MRRTLFQGVTCPFLIKADESKTGIRYFNALATILSKMPAQALKRSMRARGAVSGSKLTGGSDSGEELSQAARSRVRLRISHRRLYNMAFAVVRLRILLLRDQRPPHEHIVTGEGAEVKIRARRRHGEGDFHRLARRGH